MGKGAPMVVPETMTKQNYEDRRNAPRQECNVAAIISDRNGQVLAACRIKDISDTGARMAAADAAIKLLKPGDEVISTNDLYGGSYRMFTKIFAHYGYVVVLNI